MTSRMLIDANHPEETRVVVVDGKRLEEFDYETAAKQQLKGNIYLAKVTRVEPSLQAAFVEYGGNRHGFLAFSEIHPDYYQIPVADRQALLEQEAAAASEAAEEEDSAAEAADENGDAGDEPEPIETIEPAAPRDLGDDDPDAEPAANGDAGTLAADADENGAADDGRALASADADSDSDSDATADTAAPSRAAESARPDGAPAEETEAAGDDDYGASQRRRLRRLRHYKIQEVIKRRQILLVQVAKEERGNKGAALTTYISLAGRYCVLMPNTARGGGISRKIVSAEDRRRLKKIAVDLEIPEGMGLIVRTAGMGRNKTEIKRDFEYLLKLWDNVREATLQSTAPALIYEEASLIKRAIRDLYHKDVEEVLVEGDAGYRSAKEFMRLMMSSHARKVKLYKEHVPLFQRYQVEHQLASMHNPEVQLRSGGYIVINSTEALVAIDVNSGRSTRERNIEETALKTNLEAAEEVARQLRLRDLAGLIVVDFIDMDESRNNRNVERRFKDLLKHDRARIQVGRISQFGLLELSRQRLRPSLEETSSERCPHCGGTGHIRSVESTALHVLRMIEEEGLRERSAEVSVYVPTRVALYILNQKRDVLTALEAQYGMRIALLDDDSLIPPNMRIERVRTRTAADGPPRPITAESVAREEPAEDEAEEPEETEPEAAAADTGERKEDGGRRPRRRRRRGRRRDGEGEGEREVPAEAAQDDAPQAAPGSDEDAPAEDEADAPAVAAPGEDEAAGPSGRRRRRGRRGGRRRRRGEEGERASAADSTETDDGAVDDGVADEPYVRMIETPGGVGAEIFPETAGAYHQEESAEEPPAAVAPSAAPQAPPRWEPAPEPEPESEPEPVRAAEPTPQTTAPEPVDTPKPLDVPAPAAAATQPPMAPEPADNSPARRGWWQRILG